MSIAPTTTAKKGEVILQPAYFTSSIFVDALREDILALVQVFITTYTRTSDRPQPFNLFKTVWTAQGWPWLMLRTLDDRSRDKFLQVVVRLFVEKTSASEESLDRVVALFALYTFCMSQPSISAPKLLIRQQFPIPIDLYTSLINVPDALTASNLVCLRQHAIYTLSKLIDAQTFYILPPSDLHAQNPRELPREVFVEDRPGAELLAELTGNANVTVKKKVGRKTNRERARMAKAKIDALNKWLEKTAFTYPPNERPPGASMPTPVEGSEEQTSMHVLITGAPTMSRNAYRTNKFVLLETLNPTGNAAQVTPDDVSAEVEAEARTRKAAQLALTQANTAVLARLRRIDELAAQKGLEVGGAGGDRTGLERVERAVHEMGRVGLPGRRGGILGLLEGGGMQRDLDVVDDETADESQGRSGDSDAMQMDDPGPSR